MLFNEFGSKKNPPVLLMHGMLQDWHYEYEMLKPLEEHYRLIIPAMDGFYPNSKNFTSFEDQCSQIEEYVQKNYNGKLHGVFGQSQGGLMMVELLTRDKIEIKTAVLDGVYVAHQGRIAGWVTFWMINSAKKNNGNFPKLMDVMMKRMGLGEEDYAMYRCLYWDASEESMKRNILQNYTYHTRPEIADTKTKVYLWCGSKEPYAIKSHNILKKYLKDYEEKIFEGMGHGQMFLHHQEEMCDKICKVMG